jgi:hypothetical protein
VGAVEKTIRRITNHRDLAPEGTSLVRRRSHLSTSIELRCSEERSPLINGTDVVGQQENTPTGCSKRPSSKAAGESKPEAYPLGYVEDFDEPRTKLADVFSILLERRSLTPVRLFEEERALWKGLVASV